MENLKQLADILLAGETYLNTTRGLKTQQGVAELLEEFIPGGDAKAEPSKYEGIHQTFPYSQREFWFIAERQADGKLHILFDVEDEQEADYFLARPAKIIEQVEHTKYVRTLKARSEGKYIPPVKGAGKKQHERTAKEKSADAEEAAASGIADDVRGHISGG